MRCGADELHLADFAVVSEIHQAVDKIVTFLLGVVPF
jgi:hypothetical protein